MSKSKDLSKKEMSLVFDGKDLRKLRNEVCYSQEYMANQLSLSQSTYQRLETGEIKISVQRLSEIAKVLNKSLEQLINLNNTEPTAHKKDYEMQKEVLELKQKISQQEKQIEELKIILASKS